MSGESSGLSLLLVGAGKMGMALLSGWIRNGVVSPRNISILEPTPSSKLQDIVNEHKLVLNPSVTSLSARGLSAVILATKPQNMTEVLTYLKPIADPNTLFLSIAAGKTVASIRRELGKSTSLIRAMPNLPAAVGSGITAIFADSQTLKTHKELGAKLMASVGEIVFVEEEMHMNAVTAVSGSGPAYVFYLVECLAKAGEQAGLPAMLALQLARATVCGAGKLVEESNEDPSKLRESVTSKGGTTVAALDILMSTKGLEPLLTQAVAAAAKRAKELEI